MPRFRRKFTRRPKRSYRKRPMMRRKRSSKYSRKRSNLTGIGPRKYIKVRKDIIYNIAANSAPAPSWNLLLCGGAQTANLQTFQLFTGNSVTAIDATVDNNGATGLSQWFAFYERYYVCGSKCKVSMNCTFTSNGGEGDSMVATLVPTVGFCLAADNAGATTFDAVGIDPGELPYARRVMAKTSYAGQSTLSSYTSIKRMLGVKDLSDAAGNPSASSVVPQITDTVTAGVSSQPTVGGPKGVYWNLVLQNPQQYAITPGTINTTGVTLRMQITSYICFSGRKPLDSS